MSIDENGFALHCAAAPDTDPPVLAGADVIVDQWHRANVAGDLPLADGKQYLSVQEWRAADDRSDVIVLVDTRSECWAGAISELFRDSGRDLQVYLATSHDHLAVLEGLVDARLRQHLEVHAIAEWQQLSFTGVRTRRLDAGPIMPLLVGLRAGQEPLLRRQEERFLTAAALSLGHSPGVEPPADDRSVGEAERLLARIAALEDELSALQIRHANLANSTLGRITRRYWDLRKRLRR